MDKQLENMVERIKKVVKKECTGCEFQDGKYCSWSKKQRISYPSCQQNMKTDYVQD